jgi:hypothetical protein
MAIRIPSEIDLNILFWNTNDKSGILMGMEGK